MIKRAQRLDAVGDQRVDQPLVKVEPGLVDPPGAFGKNAAPRDREAIGLEAELLHQRDVALHSVVMVAGHVAGVALGRHQARIVAEALPDARPGAVGQRRALDLIGGGGRAPQEIVGETGHFLSLLSGMMITIRLDRIGLPVAAMWSARSRHLIGRPSTRAAGSGPANGQARTKPPGGRALPPIVAVNRRGVAAHREIERCHRASRGPRSPILARQPVARQPAAEHQRAGRRAGPRRTCRARRGRNPTPPRRAACRR